MKSSIKTTIGIIAITLASITIAQAGQNRHERDHDSKYDRGYFGSYEKPRHGRHFRKHERRQHSKRAKHGHERYREQRHYRKHHYYSRHNRYGHSARHHRKWSHGHNERRFNRHDRYTQSRSSHRIVVSGDHLLPVITGGVVASSIARNIIRHDPVARTILKVLRRH